VKALLYRIFSIPGVWAVSVVAWFVTTWYFLFRSARRKESERFYRALFPDGTPAQIRGRVWRQFHAFSGLFAERLRLARGKPPRFTSDGWELFEQTADAGAGGLILMSHLGNWELAARLFRRKGLRLMLFLGARQKEQIESMQKADLLGEGIRLVVAEEGGAGAFNGLEGLTFLKEGGFVSMPGDRIASGTARMVQVSFQGHEISLPQAPYALALVAGVPLFVFFALRERGGSYHIICRRVEVKAASRKARDAAIQAAAQRYADILAEVARRYPEQWYCFDRFLGERAAERTAPEA